MLKALFGNETCEKILLYLTNYQTGYASAIAATFGFNLRRVQLQLDRLENGGIIVSRKTGNTRIYQLNPKWYFKRELEALLQKALSALSREECDEYFTERTRPRKKGKELWPKSRAQRP
jgi:hypothetical protein